VRPAEPHLTLRAVYKAVNQLIASGVLLKVGKVVQIDQEWLRKLRSEVSPSATLSLAPGERVSYSFTSIEHLDAFWKTIALGLEEHERDGQVFFYNPHDFWAYVPGRKESEETYYRHFAEARIHAFLTIGGTTPADMEFKRQYQNEYLQIDARDISALGRTKHLTVLGDFVITVRVGRALAAEIDALYARGTSTEAIAPELETLYQTPARIRFTLEHSPGKAKKFRKLLSRNFYFRRP